MTASTLTPAFAALLCLGLCVTPGNQVQAGTPHKPSIWATPGPWVSKQSSVTLWCQGPPQAAEYRLYKEGIPGFLAMEASPDPRGPASFTIENMNGYTAGQYQCEINSTDHPAQLSDPLTLVMIGRFPAPLLEVHPSPVVVSGENVTLACIALNSSDTFYLVKEGSTAPQRGKSHITKLVREGLFPLGPVNASHGGTYRCYSFHSSQPNSWSLPSAPLRLQVTGVYEAPSLWAQPGNLLLSGDRLTLQCYSEKFDVFTLTKEQEGPIPLPGPHEQSSPNFLLGPVNSSHGGRYRCYGRLRHAPVWSKPSAPLDILVAGTGRRPLLSAQPGPHVPPGSNPTLLCRSAMSSDTFHLSKDGLAAVLLHYHLDHPAAPSQANFTLRDVSPAHSGTYRCYSSNSTAPHLLSLPSEPLELLVTGLPLSLPLLLGLSAAFILLSLLLGLLLLRHCRRRQAGHTKSGAAQDRALHESSSPSAPAQEDDPDAAATHPQSYEEVQLYPQCINNEDLKGDTHDRVNHTRLRQNEQSEDTQDVTYAQLNLLALRKQATAASSLETLPEDHSVYSALAPTKTGPKKGPDSKP